MRHLLPSRAGHAGLLVVALVPLFVTTVLTQSSIRYVGDGGHREYRVSDGVLTVTRDDSYWGPTEWRASLSDLDLNGIAVRGDGTVWGFNLPARRLLSFRGGARTSTPTLGGDSGGALGSTLLEIACNTRRDCESLLDTLNGRTGTRPTTTEPPPAPPASAPSQGSAVPARGPSPRGVSDPLVALLDAVAGSLPTPSAADLAVQFTPVYERPGPGKEPFTWGFIQRAVTCGTQRQIYVSQVFGYCALEIQKSQLLSDSEMDFTRSLGVECMQPSRITQAEVTSNLSREVVERQRAAAMAALEFAKHVDWYAGLDYYSSRCR